VKGTIASGEKKEAGDPRAWSSSLSESATHTSSFLGSAGNLSLLRTPPLFVNEFWGFWVGVFGISLVSSPNSSEPKSVLENLRFIGAGGVFVFVAVEESEENVRVLGIG